MRQKINLLIKDLLKERVENCKCQKPINKVKVDNNKIDIYCWQCGWNE